MPLRRNVGQRQPLNQMLGATLFSLVGKRDSAIFRTTILFIPISKEFDDFVLSVSLLKNITY